MLRLLREDSWTEKNILCVLWENYGFLRFTYQIYRLLKVKVKRWSRLGEVVCKFWIFRTLTHFRFLTNILICNLLGTCHGDTFNILYDWFPGLLFSMICGFTSHTGRTKNICFSHRLQFIKHEKFKDQRGEFLRHFRKFAFFQLT